MQFSSLPTPTLPAASINRGDVYWIAPTPGEEDQPSDTRAATLQHAHPHVVVSEDVFNHSRITTVVVCALTTNLHRGKEPGNVLLDDGEGNLPKPSVVVVSQISSVAKHQLGAKIGFLSVARVDEIIAGLGFLQRSFFARG